MNFQFKMPLTFLQIHTPFYLIHSLYFENDQTEYHVNIFVYHCNKNDSYCKLYCISPLTLHLLKKQKKSEKTRFPDSKKGDNQIRTGDRGVADLCLTTWLCRHIQLISSFYYIISKEISQYTKTFRK